MSITLVRDTAAEALFVSDLQPSDRPSPVQVEQAITSAILRFSAEGVAEMVAEEFGNHPETACRRMRWALQAIQAPAAPVTGS